VRRVAAASWVVAWLAIAAWLAAAAAEWMGLGLPWGPW
jgi:hypothetical protein